MKHFEITADRLVADGACGEQVERVRAMFGDGAIPCHTRNLRRAATVGLSIWWLERYIPPAAWAEYERVTALALAEYERVTGAALAAALRRAI